MNRVFWWAFLAIWAWAIWEVVEAAPLAPVVQSSNVTFRVWVETPMHIQRGWYAQGGKGNVAGWSQWVGGGESPRVCVIHVPPLDGQTITLWVHEIKHCSEGRWHD